MRRQLRVTLLLSIVCWAAAGATPPTDAVLDTLAEWTRLSMEELRLEGAPAPHRVVTAVADVTGYRVTASFGEIVDESPTRYRQGRVEVVVGNDGLDSSRFEDSEQRSWVRRQQMPLIEMRLAVEDGELALARDLWSSVDASYKKAVQRWKAKVAAREAVGGEAPPPDWSGAEPVNDVDLSPLAPVDGAALRSLAVSASEVLWQLGGLDVGEVRVNGVGFRYYTVTSEGIRLARPEGYVVVDATAELLKDDGVRIRDELQWVVRAVPHLPSRERIVEQVRAMGRNVLERAAAPTVDYYEGPVVFEDRAAAEFFRYLLPREISGTPPAPQPGRSYQRQTRTGPRLGRRLLPAGWSVHDDPTRALEGLAGGYPYDREGVRGQPVQLVEDGYVRDLLMSRVPRAEKLRSNGHARGSVSGEWTARPSIWEVRPPRSLSEKTFAGRVDEVRERARQERILVVRRLSRSRPGGLPAPTDAVLRHADGSEEPVGSLEFQNVDRRTMKNVAAAGGGSFVLPYLANFEPDRTPDRERGLPMVLTAPRKLLVEDMELVFPGSSEKPYSYPRPAEAGP